MPTTGPSRWSTRATACRRTITSSTSPLRAPACITGLQPGAGRPLRSRGLGSGIAVDGVVQEVDIRTGLVMWEWHGLGHVDVGETYSKAPAQPALPYDYFHVNSLTPDSHGNLLISARNTWALYDSTSAAARSCGDWAARRAPTRSRPACSSPTSTTPNAAQRQHQPVRRRGRAARQAPLARRGRGGSTAPRAEATLVTSLVRTMAPVATGSQGDSAGAARAAG